MKERGGGKKKSIGGLRRKRSLVHLGMINAFISDKQERNVV